MKRDPTRSTFPVSKGEATARSLAPVQVRREATADGGALLHINLSSAEYAVPPRQFVADYAEVKVGADGVHLLFGKLDSFQPNEGTLTASLEVSFPYSRFIQQLYRSIVKANGGRPFCETAEAAQRDRGYPNIDAMPQVRASKNQGTIRANAAAMYIYDDEACIDFFFLDAYSLHIATQGAREVNLSAPIRVVTAPNVLAYFVRSVIRGAQEVLARVPSLRKEDADA